MKTIWIKTLGCKVNQCESEAIENALIESDSGIALCQDESADVVVVNTCSVTSKAAMQSRQAVRQAVRNHPGARIVVTGCHAQTAPEQFGAMDGVDLVIGNREKHRIPGRILAQINSHPKHQTPNNTSGHRSAAQTTAQKIHCPDITKTTLFDSLPAIAQGARTRPFLKIQDGCNAFCTYCIVPHARGRSRSLEVDQVLRQIQQLGQSGYKEVVLTGIHIGCYGQDLTPKTALPDLLWRIREAGNIDRVRLSSIEPAELSNAIIQMAAEKERVRGSLCPHFHIPLQSGDNDILQRMHRPYTKEYFSDLIFRIVERIPTAAIGVDTLIGFPGETTGAFENSFELIRSLPIAYLHVFPFSPREGTPAYTYEDQIHSRVIKDRCKQMRRLGQDKRTSFYGRFIEQTVNVLVEERRDKDSGLLKGITNNYVPVRFEGPDKWVNSFQRVNMLRIAADGVPEGKRIK